MMTNHEFVIAAKLRYLNDAIFHAKVWQVMKALDTNLEDEQEILAICCGLHAAEVL